MCGVELNNADDPLIARRTCARMVRRGVLSRSMGNLVTLVPPLTVTSEEIDRIVDVLSAALTEAGV
jgi:adenosylmethionine---8-amino-7-oxononanoate aminotransferase